MSGNRFCTNPDKPSTYRRSFSKFVTGDIVGLANWTDICLGRDGFPTVSTLIEITSIVTRFSAQGFEYPHPAF